MLACRKILQTDDSQERNIDMMVLSSASFEEGQEIPQKHAKKIENVSPQLSWKDVPHGTKSFALAMLEKHHVARDYVHWLVADIDADTIAVKEGASGSAMPPESREIKAYVGPFPPSGTHDYEFTLYALRTDKLDLPKKVSLEDFVEAVKPNTLTTAKLVGKFTKVRAK
jgi:Raf kinase inhibitor-like YbhB/YbcL family protein